MGIRVPPDSTGQTVETNSPDGLTQRQVLTVGDASSTTTAEVQTTEPNILDGGITVRDVFDASARVRRQLDEMETLTTIDAFAQSVSNYANDRVTLLDRRGSRGRGSTR